jgi:hypothetical protein
MSADIHGYAQVRTEQGWEEREMPDFGRDYAVFGFFADVRNYSKVGPIAEPRGLPDDVGFDEDRLDEAHWSNHSHSWLTLAELHGYDYDQIVWDRRVTRDGNGGVTTDDPAEGERLPLRDFLGAHFFACIGELVELGAPDDVRIVFWFDN